MLVKGSTDILIHSTIGKVIATSALKAPEGFTKIAPSAVVILEYGAAFFIPLIHIKWKYSN
jgi:small multidrug resistance pump